MTFKAQDSLAEQIAHYLAERIIRGELKEGERIQEQKVTQALNVSRGSVREALLILERRHLIIIQPRRGAHVSELSAHKVQSLYALSVELYCMLARAVINGWQEQADLAPFLELRQRLSEHQQRDDIGAFVDGCFDVMRAAFPFADNPYLQETLENLQPAICRTYYLALEQRRSEMGQFLNTFISLLQAIIARDYTVARRVLKAYGERNCQLVLATLAQR